ncbi:HELICASE-LIKE TRANSCRIPTION FACTOR CHR28 [Salix koriyanagi]|uniref:HELICASE-LIKE TRANSCRIPTION FACTOR CHR28 n=1 Tax=Salix koriyanagi TaxID=2511006 RepID=A0A9Q0ZFH8_9ROSI|nr:HELICASE-LIKE TRANSCRIPTION FACTOR CHR28 [Salix koriyanagi]
MIRLRTLWLPCVAMFFAINVYQNASSSHSKYDDNSIVLQHEYSSSKIKAVLEVIQSHCKAGSPISEFNGSAGCSETSMAYSNLSTEGPIKAIVFSQWTSMLDLVEFSLNQHCIQYRRLDGTMTLSSRDKAVKDFNTDPEVTVMLMSLKAGNLGLNMVAACHVILLDLWWNPTTEDQAIDRAHRIGQTRPVTVTRLTIKDTVEDRILALQDEKRKMVASAFGEDQSGGSAARLTVEDLKYLFMFPPLRKSLTSPSPSSSFRRFSTAAAEAVAPASEPEDSLTIKGAKNTEHKCVLDSCRHLQQEGFDVTYLPVGNDGIVDLEKLKGSIRRDTGLVSVMAVNNEIGVIQPMEEIGKICKELNVSFHTDAAQALGKIPIDVDKWNAAKDKGGAPNEWGWTRERDKEWDGAHSFSRGNGGTACELAKKEMDYDDKRIGALQERLLNGVRAKLGGVVVNGSVERRYAGNLHLSFAYVEGESLLMGLKDVAVSSGSACTSASLEPSYVLRALGVDEDMAHTSI